MRYIESMRYLLPALIFFVACTKEKIPDLVLLQGACEVVVKSDVKNSDIYIDGILIGHGEASTKVPCGQKRITVEAGGKWTIEEYKTVDTRLPLEVEYTMKDISGIKD